MIYEFRNTASANFNPLLILKFIVENCNPSNKAYARFPMGDTSAVSNSNVVWTSLIAYIVLKEKLHWLDLVAIPLTIGYYLN